MAITINGTALSLTPTSHGWIPRVLQGRGGAGHPFYAPVREYELNWDLISASDFHQLKTFFDSVGVTGTVVAGLPQYGAATYTIFAYSGCILNEPEVSVYFEQHTTNVRLLITNIRT